MSSHPTPIGDRGTRYLQRTKAGDLTAPDEKLRDFVMRKLHKLDVDGALGWYEHTWPTLTDDQKAYLGCNDRYALMVLMLGRKDMIAAPRGEWLYDRCREVEAEPDGYLDLWARYHYKSSIITQAGIIQEILIDPNITIAIFSNTQPTARRFQRQIMDVLQSNGLLKRIYSDVLYADPKKASPLWSRSEGLIVKRVSTAKEPTLSSYSVLRAMPTSTHFQLLVYDDLIDKTNVTNAEMIQRTTEGWELSTNLGIGEMTRVWMIGTRYSFGDTYEVIIQRHAATPRLYPATVNGKLTGTPVFMTQKGWDDVKKKQRGTVAAQMLQNPLQGKEATFDIDWFRPWLIRPTLLNVYILCDPSRGRTKTSDRTAISVIALDVHGNKYLIDGARHRMKLSERYEYLKQLYRKYTTLLGVQNVMIGYERFGQQADDEVFNEWQERDNYFWTMEELAWPREGPMSKKHRVERLEPDFKGGNFFLPGLIDHPEKGLVTWKVNDNSQFVFSPLVNAETGKPQLPRLMETMKAGGQGHRNAKAIVRKDEDGERYDVTWALIQEMLYFPLASHDDLVDATSRIYDIGAVKPRKVSSEMMEKFYADT